MWESQRRDEILKKTERKSKFIVKVLENENEEST
jgi:hypothetical protein